MTRREIIELFERLARLSNGAKETKGEASTWTYTFPDGETHSYILTGLKSHVEIDDAVKSLLLWIWSAKDYLKICAEDHGKTGRSVEETIDDYPNLQICADLANRLKHLKLEWSRTGLFPYLGKLRCSIPQEAINSITFRAFEVETEVADPNLVTVTLPVFDQNGNELGDAFEYARKAITDLEKIRETIEK
jgi:hypothetical protein